MWALQSGLPPGRSRWSDLFYSWRPPLPNLPKETQPEECGSGQHSSQIHRGMQTSPPQSGDGSLRVQKQPRSFYFKCAYFFWSMSISAANLGILTWGGICFSFKPAWKMTSTTQLQWCGPQPEQEWMQLMNPPTMRRPCWGIPPGLILTITKTTPCPLHCCQTRPARPNLQHASRFTSL